MCNVAVTDPKLAGELWINGKDATQPAANPGCLLRAVREANARGEQVRAAYVPDTEFGTRWFADKSIWVQDGRNYLPFGTLAGAAALHRSPPRRDGRRLPAGASGCGVTAAPAVLTADAPAVAVPTTPAPARQAAILAVLAGARRHRWPPPSRSGRC